MKKKLLALLLSAAMVVSLTACGGSTDSASNEAAATEEAVATEEAAGTEETVATMEQLDGVVNECRDTTKELTRISNKLIENANKFKLS